MNLQEWLAIVSGYTRKHLDIGLERVASVAAHLGLQL
jgi:hypothetical protein